MSKQTTAASFASRVLGRLSMHLVQLVHEAVRDEYEEDARDREALQIGRYELDEAAESQIHSHYTGVTTRLHARIVGLRAALRTVYREHHTTCPLYPATPEERTGAAGCLCGADIHNARVDTAFASDDSVAAEDG